MNDTSELRQDQIGPAVNLLNEETRVAVVVPGFPHAKVTTLLYFPTTNTVEVRVEA